jgi:outer membrane lipoprotein-sorting protein
VAVIISASTPSFSNDAADARAVIDKAIKAIGGEEKLAKTPASTWSEKGTYYGMGDGMPYTGKYAVQWPNQFRMEIEGVFTIVLNGDQAWMNGQDMEKEQIGEHKEGHYTGWVSTLLPLKDPAFKLTLLPETKVDNKSAVGVKVSRQGHRDVNLFFDKETGLLVKTATRAKAEEQGGKEVNQETYYQNYKEADGVKTPMKIVVKRDDKPYVEAEISDLKRSPKLDDKLFSKS